jgi:hypothetical protein
MDSKIGVKIIARLIMSPALVAEVFETPEVSQKRMSPCEVPRPIPRRTSGRVNRSRLIDQIRAIARDVEIKRRLNTVRTGACSVRVFAER